MILRPATTGELTYMSIDDEISAHAKAGALVLFRPRSRRPIRRLLFLTRNAAKALSDPHSAVELLGSRAAIEDAMTRWTTGERVNGHRIDGILRCSFICRLAPPPPEIWEIRITEPIVRSRILGRFAEPDILIATSLRTRTLLGRRCSSNWAVAMKDCEQTWNQLFPARTPFTAARAREYITENCDDFEL
jgi:hypothetical protein